MPGYKAPANLAYSRRNRSAAGRIPVYSPCCNPYLAFSAMLMAGLDGIRHKIDSGQPLDNDVFELEAEEAAKIAGREDAQRMKCSRQPDRPDVGRIMVGQKAEKATRYWTQFCQLAYPNLRENISTNL